MEQENIKTYKNIREKGACQSVNALWVCGIKLENRKINYTLKLVLLLKLGSYL